MINKTSKISKANKYHLPQVIEHKKEYPARRFGAVKNIKYYKLLY
jgi:hypothetical protein